MLETPKTVGTQPLLEYNYNMMVSENPTDDTMGNQQERLQRDIGYLLGIIDGEGSYQLATDNTRLKRYWAPILVVSNTDMVIIERLARIFDQLEVSYAIWTPKLYGLSRFPLHRITVKGVSRMGKLLKILCQYEHAKLPQANLLNEWVRLRQPLSGARAQHAYTQAEVDIKNELGRLNKLHNTRGRILRDYTLDSINERIPIEKI